MGSRARLGVRRRIQISPLLWVFLIIIFLVSSFFVVDRTLSPTLRVIATKQTSAYTLEVLERSIQQEIVNKVDYSDLIIYSLDSDGRVAFMQANTIEITRLSTQTAIVILEDLRKLEGRSFTIPTGQLLGSDLLASYGPDIKVTMIPTGTVDVRVGESFTEAGINQTRHMLYLDIRAEVRVVVPLFKEDTVVETRVPLTDFVIVGPVPSMYVQIGDLFLGR